MKRIATAAAVAIFALSAMPNASEASHSKRHHKHHHVAATTRADDCFLTRMFKRVADVVRCRV